MRRVGFAGLGRMGAPMAANVVVAGFEVALWNRTIETAERLGRETGAAVSSTPWFASPTWNRRFRPTIYTALSVSGGCRR